MATGRWRRVKRSVARAFEFTPRTIAACHAFTQWIGETCIGLIPLLAFAIMHKYSSPGFSIMACSSNAQLQVNSFTANCLPLIDNIGQELCILTVVISGLALLSIFSLGSRRRRSPSTPWTFLLSVATILSLITGAILYAVLGARIDHDTGTITLLALFTALGSSLFLALEGAILDA